MERKEIINHFLEQHAEFAPIHARFYELAAPFMIRGDDKVFKKDDRAHALHVSGGCYMLHMLEGGLPEITMLAAEGHDLGWAQVPDYMVKGFDKGDPAIKNLLRLTHEKYSIRITDSILTHLGLEDYCTFHSRSMPGFRQSIISCIEGHDSAPVRKTLEQKIMRDADRLARYEPTTVLRDLIRQHNAPKKQDALHQKLTKFSSYLKDPSFIITPSAAEIHEKLYDAFSWYCNSIDFDYKNFQPNEWAYLTQEIFDFNWLNVLFAKEHNGLKLRWFNYLITSGKKENDVLSIPGLRTIKLSSDEKDYNSLRKEAASGSIWENPDSHSADEITDIIENAFFNEHLKDLGGTNISFYVDLGTSYNDLIVQLCKTENQAKIREGAWKKVRKESEVPYLNTGMMRDGKIVLTYAQNLIRLDTVQNEIRKSNLSYEIKDALLLGLLDRFSADLSELQSVPMADFLEKNGISIKAFEYESKIFESFHGLFKNSRLIDIDAMEIFLYKASGFLSSLAKERGVPCWDVWPENLCFSGWELGDSLARQGIIAGREIPQKAYSSNEKAITMLRKGLVSAQGDYGKFLDSLTRSRRIYDPDKLDKKVAPNHDHVQLMIYAAHRHIIDSFEKANDIGNHRSSGEADDHNRMASYMQLYHASRRLFYSAKSHPFACYEGGEKDSLWNLLYYSIMMDSSLAGAEKDADDGLLIERSGIRSGLKNMIKQYSGAITRSTGNLPSILLSYQK